MSKAAMPATTAAAAAGAIAIMAVAATPALAIDGFRWLTIDGHRVSWQVTSGAERTTLRYAILNAPRATAGAVNCRDMLPPDRVVGMPGIGRAGLERAARQAFDRWQAVAPFAFVHTTDASNADIVIGEQADPTGHAFTNLTLGDRGANGVRAITGASICFNPERSWKIGFDGNLRRYDLVHTLTHEIGHALGLDHPGARGHIMSFLYDERRAELSEGDVDGVRAIYGFRRGAQSDGIAPDPARRSAVAAEARASASAAR